ncbi:hypothetical protein PR048_021358 [Dryococelus australis]|uniref:Uncharacterized protein n=1 Tax=Dryococelus australis TaxID=614101 RepID=A0ABQ9GXZ8_9NEOP|nr:hypothetical protein PR048_021358 [Dryococelus australis]
MEHLCTTPHHIKLLIVDVLSLSVIRKSHEVNELEPLNVHQDILSSTTRRLSENLDKFSFLKRG